MRMSTWAVCALGVLGSVTARAKTMPDNALYLEDRFAGNSGITEAQFDKVIDRATKYFAPIVAKFGGNYVVNKLWSDSTVNADSEQTGTTWNVNMYGGLARRPEVTEDGFALVLCHETGHHLGGFPFYADQTWAADEGQADYFSTTHCARVVFGDEPEINAQAAATVPAIAKAKCDSAWSTDADRFLCYRTMNASKSLADLLAALEGASVDFGTTDPSQVDATNDDHPAAQCRLDTYVAGALCLASYDAAVIAGKVDGAGTNTVQAENESAKYYCDNVQKYPVGSRPRCWFKPGI